MQVFFVNFAKSVSDDYCDLLSRFEDAGYDVYQRSSRSDFEVAVKDPDNKGKNTKFIVFIADSRQYAYVLSMVQQAGNKNVTLVLPNQNSKPDSQMQNVIASRDFTKIREFFDKEIDARTDEKVDEILDSRKDTRDNDGVTRIYFANFTKEPDPFYTATHLRLTEEGYPIKLANTREDFRHVLEDKGPRHIFVFVNDSRQFNFVQRLLAKDLVQYVTIIVTYQDSLPGYVVPGVRILAGRWPRVYLKQVEQLVYNEVEPVVIDKNQTPGAVGAVAAHADNTTDKPKKDLRKFYKKARKAQKKASKALEKADKKTLSAKTKKDYKKATKSHAKAAEAQAKADKVLAKTQAKR